MKRSVHSIRITLDVVNRRELFYAALKRAKEEGESHKDYIARRKEDGDPLATDLVTLFDPGMSPNGTKIIDSAVDADF